MTTTTVAEFAKELKKSPDTLLEQLKSAGVTKSSSADALTDADKQKLLLFLKASHGTDTPERKKNHVGQKIDLRNQTSRRHWQGSHHPSGGEKKTHLRQAR